MDLVNTQCNGQHILEVQQCLQFDEGNFNAQILIYMNITVQEFLI